MRADRVYDFSLNDFHFRVEATRNSKGRFLPHGEIVVRYQNGIKAYEGRYVFGTPQGKSLLSGNSAGGIV